MESGATGFAKGAAAGPPLAQPTLSACPYPVHGAKYPNFLQPCCNFCMADDFEPGWYATETIAQCCRQIAAAVTSHCRCSNGGRHVSREVMLAHGSCSGLVGAVVLPVVGVGVGAAQIMRGVANTPSAIKQARRWGRRDSAATLHKPPMPQCPTWYVAQQSDSSPGLTTVCASQGLECRT